jgi:hypothetical protein
MKDLQLTERKSFMKRIAFGTHKIKKNTQLKKVTLCNKKGITVTITFPLKISEDLDGSYFNNHNYSESFIEQGVNLEKDILIIQEIDELIQTNDED